jgi:hypothetical protein
MGGMKNDTKRTHEDTKLHRKGGGELQGQTRLLSIAFAKGIKSPDERRWNNQHERIHQWANNRRFEKTQKIKHMFVNKTLDIYRCKL